MSRAKVGQIVLLREFPGVDVTAALHAVMEMTPAWLFHEVRSLLWELGAGLGCFEMFSL